MLARFRHHLVVATSNKSTRQEQQIYHKESWMAHDARMEWE
jgi:hypothetical protein